MPEVSRTSRVVLSPVPNANIARHLASMAGQQPDRAALKIPRGRTRAGEIDYLTLSFAELDAEVDAWSQHLRSSGVCRGDRTLLMVKQGLPLLASAFALFRIGAVPVVIDPGMGLKSFLACVERSQPRALVGIPLAQIVSRLFPRKFATVAVRVSASAGLTARRSVAGATASATTAELAQSAPTDLAAVLFTSGSTGAPKGVCYEHGMFEAQVQMIRDAYAIEPGEIDLPLLPIFALFNPALGMTTVVPEIDPRRPAAVDPRKIVQAITQEGVTNSFGSPTLWRKIGDYCSAQNVTLPSLKRVLCAGAPVPDALWTSSRRWLTRGRLHSPYGATEVLPVSTISSDEIQSGQGACVGRPVRGNDVRIIAIDDAPIATFADVRELRTGEIGEIIASGPSVTKRYDAAPAATAAAKIAENVGPRLANVIHQSPSAEAQPFPPAAVGGAADCAGKIPGDRVWHRMGDCGYLDSAGRLWFCGRKIERVETPAGNFFTEPCEKVFRAHPRVTRCALIGLGERGQQRPALVVESALDPARATALARELRVLALAHPETAAISTFYFHPKFPVDVRHNAKIHRLALTRWAAKARPFVIE